MKNSTARRVAFVCVLLLPVSSTHRAQTAGQESVPAAQKQIYQNTGTEGTITGTITLSGEIPAARLIFMDADPVCVEVNKHPTMQDLLVRDGKLANAFVYVKNGSALAEYDFAVPVAAALLEHRQCQYVPHLLGIRAQQLLRLVNSDPTTHNTHPLPKLNTEWNRSQPVGGEPIEVKFARPETFIPFKDNQHPWEKAYVGVFSHPFFAVSAADGTYRIEGLPPGDYTIAVWHEKLGEQTVDVTVTPYQWKVLDFDFKSAAP